MKKAADTIISCLEEKGISQRQLATRMGEDVRYLNQQLKRQKDMKVERFTDVLDHIGYRVEVVENDGIQKVSPEFANAVIETREPRGMFWHTSEGRFVGIDNTDGEAWTEEFNSKEGCFAWLRGDERK